MRSIGLGTGLLVAVVIALAACKGGVAPGDAGPAVPAVKAGDAVSPAAAKGGSNGRIACDAPEHDWGSVMAGQEVNHTFVVRNAGDGVLRILNARGG